MQITNDGGIWDAMSTKTKQRKNFTALLAQKKKINQPT